jgi:hypothetical protein
MHARRSIALGAVLLFALSACSAIPVGLFEGTPDETPEPSPTPITKTFCESGADLSTDIDFLSSVEVSEDGLLTLIVSVDVALGEARTFTELASQEYGPLVADLVLALQDLRDLAQELEGQETLGSAITVVGETITEIGEAMDTLSMQLRDPCPEDDA